MITAWESRKPMMDEEKVRKKYNELTLRLIESETTITTMESATSGQVASLITDTEGASAIFKGAFVTYSNEAKIMQGVPEEVIRRYGVYSKETASAMAKACRKCYDADIGVGVTASFGNVDENNPDSVCGESYYAIATKEGVFAYFDTIPKQPDRLSYKLYLADRIADLILQKVLRQG